ncbi:MAG TPA: CARDB domain-containing protein, partial [Symbiobacteriaceae bacterium]|nr:CARDB domain-containing protein [Symbiobacteriaceae bacterium]
MRLQALLVSAALAVQPFIAVASVRAEVAPATTAPVPATPASAPVEDLPSWANQSGMSIMSTGSYSGHSGVNPYQAYSDLPSDEIFVADTGGTLDQYLCRSQGPITFNLGIDRVFGGIATLSADDTYNLLQNPFTAIANGLIEKDATLYLRVYDVDHDYQGGDYAPEVDQVSVNGRRLTRTLTSGNNRWDTVSFQVPIESFLYPRFPGIGGEPVAAPNEIKIDIDVANSEEVWCVEVDWAVLHIKAAHPAVMVNGILSNNHAWDTFGPLLWQRGLPSFAQELDATRGVFHNASDLADAMPDIKRAFGVDKMNIIAHSKGGLDSRAYLRTHDDVDTLVQLATPNRGSDCARSPLGNLLGSTWDLDPKWIFKNFNYRDTRNHFWEPHNYVPNWTEFGRAPIYIYAATKFNTTKCPAHVGDDMDPPHDSVVSHDRSTLPWNWSGIDGDGIDQGVTDAVGPYDHSGIHESTGVADQVVQWIAGGAGINSTFQAESARSLATTAAVAAAESMVEDAGARLTAGATAEHLVPIGATTMARFAVLHGRSDTQVELLAPDGRAVTATLVNQPAGMSVADLYELANPTAGTYTVRIKTAAPDFYNLQVWTEGGSSLSVQVATDTIEVGGTGDLTASLLDASGTPVVGAQVTAELFQPNGASSTVTLAEAAPGSYTGAVTSTESGLHVLVVRSQKGGEQRATSTELTVVPAGMALTVSGELTNDSNGDSLADSLVIDLSTTLPTAGLYVLSGDLYDSQGQLIQRQSVSQTAGAGAATFSLRFDGRTIYDHGADGPYTLRDVVLVAVDQDGIPVAALGAPYSTASYRAAQFQHKRLRLLGGTDQGLDTDGDGLYNWLQVSLQLGAETAGYYQTSARLVTADGEELGWSSAWAYVSGTGTATLYFDGRQIRAGGANGPFRVVDLMITGPQATVVPEAYQTTAYNFHAFQAIGPDLVVRSERITTDPASPEAGSTVQLSAVVENRGGNLAGTFPIAFYLGNPAQGGALIGQTSIAGMAAESEQVVTVPWATPADAGSYEIYVVLNAGRVVGEYDYSNDTSFQVITLGAPSISTPAALRAMVDQLALEVQAQYPDTNKNGLLAKLRAASAKLVQAEDAIASQNASARGQLTAASNDLTAFTNQL